MYSAWDTERVVISSQNAEEKTYADFHPPNPMAYLRGR